MNRIVVVDGNKAAAYGAKLSRPTVIAAYPITPQTPLVEYLSTFVAEGQLKAEMVQVESEHSALSVLQGAALAGSRVFTATSSQGLALMYEPYIRTSTLRLPIVMCIVGREVISPQSVWGGQQDSITARDAGWIQIYVENNQEIVDSIIQAYKIAEDKRVLLPVNVCFDGFYLSHMTERIILPGQMAVDEFLPPWKNEHILLDPREPMAVDPLTPGDLLTEYRYKHVQAMKKAKDVIGEVDKQFGKMFNRHYGGMLQTYRYDDADVVILTMGSMTGTARVAVDIAREQGLKTGLLKIRTLRPFPREELSGLLKDKSAVGVIDRNVCFGWSSGTVFMEIKSALSDLRDRPPIIGFIDGLGGNDITLDHFQRVFSMLEELAKGKKMEREITWLGLE
jgi:pyruvate ferredoxin oxidoreductase alpha subunit/phenylglyoxylate dehydrogenase alpha subunit